MQIGQAVQIRQVNEHRVGARIVNAALNDRRAHQHVAFMAHEAQHHLLKLIRGHLSVANFYARLGNQRLDSFSGSIKSTDSVVHVIRLPFARQFAANRLLQSLG